MVARLAALQRADVVAELAEQVAHHDTPEATAALRQLAAMSRPPVDILVAAATSADAQISHEAQLLVSSVLRRWQHRIESDRGVAGVARQLAELAEALDKHHAAFSVSDHYGCVRRPKKSCGLPIASRRHTLRFWLHIAMPCWRPWTPGRSRWQRW